MLPLRGSQQKTGDGQGIRLGLPHLPAWKGAAQGDSHRHRPPSLLALQGWDRGHKEGVPRGAGDAFTSQSSPQWTPLSPTPFICRLGVAAPSHRAGRGGRLWAQILAVWPSGCRDGPATDCLVASGSSSAEWGPSSHQGQPGVARAWHGATRRLGSVSRAEPSPTPRCAPGLSSAVGLPRLLYPLPQPHFLLHFGYFLGAFKLNSRSKFHWQNVPRDR